MHFLKHELRRNRKTTLIWSGAIGFMILLSMLMFPQMKNEADQMTELFSNMGIFTEVFGMDILHMAHALDFYGLEAGNMIGICGTIFAAWISVMSLAREEGDHTAEFLLTHPISRKAVVYTKLVSVVTAIVFFNVFSMFFGIFSFGVIGESFAWKEFLMFHVFELWMHLEIGCICFGISACISKNSLGIGIGFPLFLYFMNIFINISDKLSFLKYITPYHYAEPSTVISGEIPDVLPVLLGGIYGFLGVLTAFRVYQRKNIKA